MSEYIFRGVKNKDEQHWANDLMAKVHSRDYFESQRWIDSFGMGYPGFEMEHTRIAMTRQEIIGALRLTTDTIRIGEARLRMGGFGYVTTAGAHRHKGVSRDMIRDTLHYMYMNNYHASMLFGIPNFYHKYGFATSIGEYATYIDTSEAEAIDPPDYTLRQGKPGDIRAIQKMHDANDTRTACSLIRNAAHISNRWEQWKSLKVIQDAQGKVCGYFVPRVEDYVLQVDEVGVLDAMDHGALLYACAAEARQYSLSRICFNAPPDFPFIRYLLQFESTQEAKFQRNTGGMLAFINLAEAMESMIPEWESLLLKSPLHEHRCEITLWVNKQPIRIRANMGAVDVAATPGKNKISLNAMELIHLVTGYRYSEDILDACHRIIDAPGRLLFETLFPKRNPYVWKLDRF